jgi:hypothetical protein
MKEFIINSDLEDKEINYQYNKESFDNYFSEKNIIQNNLSDSTIKHKNYYDYLEFAYNNHLSIIIKPDNIYHLILSEISVIIQNNDDLFREFFTDSPEKKIISIDTEIFDFPLDEITGELLKQIPNKEAGKLFIPTFSTTTQNDLIAYKSLLCEGMKKYYGYMSYYSCGFKKIKVLGDKKDYKKIISLLNTFKSEFNVDPLNEYIDDLIPIIQSIYDNFDDSEFWGKIYFRFSEICGSGIDGWFLKLYSRFSTNYKNLSIAKIPFIIDNLVTEEQINAQAYYGLFESKIEDGYLVPNYSSMVFDEKLSEIETPETPKTPRSPNNFMRMGGFR